MIADIASGVTMTTALGPHVAILERVGKLTHIWPPLNVLTRTLRTTARLPDPRRVGQLTRVSERLYRRIGDPHFGPGLAVPAGLEAIVRRIYEREGYSVVEAGERPPALAEPDIESIARLGPIDPSVLNLVRRSDRGVIAYDGVGVDPSRLVAQILLAYPGATFAVICTRRRDVSRLAARLRRHVPDVRWLTGTSQLGKIGRVVVATPLALANTAVALWERAIVICMDGVEAVGANALLALRHASRARLFALRDRADVIAARDRDRIVAWFGIDEVVVPRHGYHLRPVEIAFCRIVGGPMLGNELDIVALKRAGIWGHRLRNRWITRLARDLAAGDRDALVALKAPTATQLEAVGALSVVVFENPEHALALAPGLPGWPVIVGPDINTEGLPVDQAELLARDRCQLLDAPSRAIATMEGFGSIAARPWDVIIRADGGVGVPPVVTEILIGDNQYHRPLVLVDFIDRHHPELLHRSRVRRDAYRRHGWTIDGISAPTAVDRFLAARQGRAR